LKTIRTSRITAQRTELRPHVEIENLTEIHIGSNITHQRNRRNTIVNTNLLTDQLFNSFFPTNDLISRFCTGRYCLQVYLNIQKQKHIVATT